MASSQPEISAAVPLRPYQLDWFNDRSRRKIAVKSRRIGFTFASTLEIADASADQRTKWRIVSRTQDTAKEAMLEVANHFAAMQLAEKRFKGYGHQLAIDEIPTDLFFGDVRVMKLEAQLPNKSVISAMTAHPDALRGFGGNVFLDEFGFHQNSHKLWKAAGAATMLGHRLLVVSTPNYQTGKYYELCRKAGLATGAAPTQRQHGIWSSHWVDIYDAVAQGFPVTVEDCRELADDEDTFLQEYCCQFLSDGENYIPYDLITAAESDLATLDSDLALCAPLYAGLDIGRHKDRSILWIALRVGDLLVTRAVTTMTRMPFAEQEATVDAVMPHVTRLAVDASHGSVGDMLAERLHGRWGHKIERVQFTQQTKEAMAVETKRAFEDRTLRIPASPAVRRAIHAVKRYVSSNGNLRFDAARTDAGHADEFWALALAISAASQQATSFRDAALFGSPLMAGAGGRF